MKIAIVLGTRPEIIKMSPIIKECIRLSIEYFIVHTGQHYSINMDRIFFDQLHLPKPDYNLEVGSCTHAIQTGKIMAGVEKVLSKDIPDFVLLEGDTNTVLGGAIAAAKLHIKTGHVEAGLRSYDRTMPEEINRILTDHCSNLLFAPTENAKKILLNEGIFYRNIFNTGNTIVDATYQNIGFSRKTSDIIDKLALSPNNYFLLTLHREENVNSISRFKNIIGCMECLFGKLGIPIIFPVHPRSEKMLQEFRIQHNNLTLVKPLDYFSFLELERNARLILTDSGGVQEEACILRVPCITLRDNTERIETVEIGANMIAGIKPNKILQCIDTMLDKKRNWSNPFGDGTAGKKIIKILLRDH